MLNFDILGAGLTLGLPIIIVGAFACLLMKPISLSALLLKINAGPQGGSRIENYTQSSAPVQKIPQTQPAAAPVHSEPTNEITASDPVVMSTATACPGCQKAVSADDVFCTSCGNRLK